MKRKKALNNGTYKEKIMLYQSRIKNIKGPSIGLIILALCTLTSYYATRSFNFFMGTWQSHKPHYTYSLRGTNNPETIKLLEEYLASYSPASYNYFFGIQNLGRDLKQRFTQIESIECSKQNTGHVHLDICFRSLASVHMSTSSAHLLQLSFSTSTQKKTKLLHETPSKTPTIFDTKNNLENHHTWYSVHSENTAQTHNKVHKKASDHLDYLLKRELSYARFSCQKNLGLEPLLNDPVEKINDTISGGEL